MTLLTVGDIVRRTKAPVHKVEYIIASRQIPAAARVGRFRVFDESGLARIESELQKLNPSRES